MAEHPGAETSLLSFRGADAVPSLESTLEFFSCTAHGAIEFHCAGWPRVRMRSVGFSEPISAARQVKSIFRVSNSNTGCRPSAV